MRIAYVMMCECISIGQRLYDYRNFKCSVIQSVKGNGNGNNNNNYNINWRHNERSTSEREKRRKNENTTHRFMYQKMWKKNNWIEKERITKKKTIQTESIFFCSFICWFSFIYFRLAVFIKCVKRRWWWWNW